MAKQSQANRTAALLEKISLRIECLGILTQLLIDEVRTARGKKPMTWKSFWDATLKGEKPK